MQKEEQNDLLHILHVTAMAIAYELSRGRAIGTGNAEVEVVDDCEVQLRETIETGQTKTAKPLPPFHSFSLSNRSGQWIGMDV